jgi:hypothetical protein
MDSITNTNTDDLQVSEPWFQVMDPICLDNICENDLEQWSIRKRSEEYLPVHQEGPFPLTGNDCFSSERVRDSIYLYKLRMARHHDVEPQTPKSSSKLIKFDTTCFGSSAPSSARLSKQLKTYRQKLAEKPSERTSDTLLDLEAELSATFDLVRQKLREQEITPSDKNPSNKSSLSSRASNLSQKVARKVTHSLSATILCNASQNKSITRPKTITKASWTSTTKSKLAAKVRTLVDGSPRQKRKDSAKSDSTITSHHQFISPITFNTMNWKLSPKISTESIKTLYSKLHHSRTSSKSSSPPSPRSKSHCENSFLTQLQQSSERREKVEGGDACPSIISQALRGREETKQEGADYFGEQAGRDVKRQVSRDMRRLGFECQRSSGSEEQKAQEGEVKSRLSVAESISVYSRAVSG